MLRIRVIGGVRADVDGREVDLASAARARGLLAWLAVHPGTHARSVLAARLRPDVRDDSARKSLRQAAWSLRTALGDAGAALVGDRERLGLTGDPALVAVDLAEFRRLRDAGDLAGAVAVGEGELLAGLDEEWAPALREAHRAEMVALLGRLADDADGRGDIAEAVAWARRQVAADPLAEIAARRLVALLARAGDRAGALAAYEALRERLRRELGVVASAETRELAEEVRRGRPARAAGAAGTAQPALPPPLVRTGPFVGRAGAAGRVAAAWRDAAGGPRVVMLAGEPGIGKTRLAAHVAAGVHAGGALVLYGRCDEDTLVPHQPFVEALERHLAALPATERDEVIGAARADLARVLPGVAPPEGAAHDDDPDTARYRAFEAVRAVLQSCAAGRPALLVLDDLHWADRPTLLLLRHLGRMLEPVPLLLLGTYRDTEVDARHPLAATLGDLRRDHPVVTVSLEGLADDEVADLVRAADGAAGEAATLAARARGNPLFVEELVRDLREGGDGGALPERVADVVTRRVDRLGEDAAGVLVTAAFLGPEFATDVLEELHGADAALDAIDRARAAGLLAETAPAGARHAFTHALVADALASRPSACAARACTGASAPCSRRGPRPTRRDTPPTPPATSSPPAGTRSPRCAGRWWRPRAPPSCWPTTRPPATGMTPSPRCRTTTPAAGPRSRPSARRSPAPAPAARRRRRSTRPRRPPAPRATPRSWRGRRSAPAASASPSAGPIRGSWACWRRRWRWTPRTPTRCGARAC